MSILIQVYPTKNCRSHCTLGWKHLLDLYSARWLQKITYIFVSEQVISLFSFVGAHESKRKFYSLSKSEYVVCSSSIRGQVDLPFFCNYVSSYSIFCPASACYLCANLVNYTIDEFVSF